MTKPHVVGKDALTETAVTTSGMTRHVAFQGKDFRVSRSLVVPGIVSGWHHHGAYDQYGYMVSGTASIRVRTRRARRNHYRTRRLLAHASEHDSS